MRMIVTNLSAVQRSFDLQFADGTMVNELIPAGCAIAITDIDPFDVNTDKLTRELVFAQGAITVTFEPEPDDLVGLGISRVLDEGTDLGQFFTSINFIGGAVTAAPSLVPGRVDVTVTAGSGTLDANDFREYVALSGLQDDSNLVFTIPDKAKHDPPKLQLKVYRNGVLQNPGSLNDYVVTESGGPGTGFDTITFATGSAPLAWESLWASYVLY